MSTVAHIVALVGDSWRWPGSGRRAAAGMAGSIPDPPADPCFTSVQLDLAGFGP